MSNWFEDYIQYYYIHFYHWVLTTVRRVENIRSQMWWRKISLSSRLSLLFRQSKNTELSFFVSQIFTSALFYSSSLSFFTTSLHIFLFFSLFCALMVTIFLYKCTFFSCSSVHSSLHYIFFLQCSGLYLLRENDDQHCRSGSENSTGTYNHHSCSFFSVSMSVCCIFRLIS